MKKSCSLSVVALAALIAGCGAPSSDVSPKVDGEIRNNLSRELTPDELAKMGGGGNTPSQSNPGSAPAEQPGGPKKPVTSYTPPGG